MEIVLNTSIKPFNFSFYIQGKLITVQLPPGAVRVKKEHMPYLRAISMFGTLESDNVLVVGVKGSDDTPVANEIGKGMAGKARATAKPIVETKSVKSKKATNMDLADL